MSDDRPRSGLNAWSLLGIGSYNVVCVMAGMALGWFLDGRLGTTPGLTLTGLALGVVAGVVGTWHRIRSFLA